MESKRAVPTFNSVAAEIGELVTSKNEAYGDSFAKCGEFLRLLYPAGLEPSKYGDALSMVRIFDKQMRIATRKDAFGESPYNDICGYGLLGATADAKAALFHTPLAPEEVKSIADAIAPPSLCVSCHRECEDKYKLDMCECIGYLPNEGAEDIEQVKVDEWAEKDLCRKCVNNACYAAGKKLRTDFCVNYYDEKSMGAAPARFASPPSLCGTCIRQGCPLDCAEHTTECGEYLPQGAVGKETVNPSLCRMHGSCANFDGGKTCTDIRQCHNYRNSNGPEVTSFCHSCRDVGPCMSSLKWEEGGCEGYSPATELLQDAPEPLSLALPSITVEGDLEKVMKKYEEEITEWENAYSGSVMEAVEAWDVIQVRQTYAERGGAAKDCKDISKTWIQLRHKESPKLVEAALRGMLMKNALRSYYSPEVNERIILSGGKEW